MNSFRKFADLTFAKFSLKKKKNVKCQICDKKILKEKKTKCPLFPKKSKYGNFTKFRNSGL